MHSPLQARRTVRIRLHAYPQLIVDDRPVPLQLKRVWALLACLGEPGCKLARARLAHLLWPDADTTVGRARLRRLVHQANTAAGLDVVQGDSDALWLAQAPAAPVLDLHTTRRAAFAVLDAGDHEPVDEAAAACLLAPSSHTILADFGLDADTFESWLAARRQEHEQLVLRALQRLAERRLRQATPEPALAAARRLLEIDPYADGGHAVVIEALGRLGRAAAAEAAYHRCASLMRLEFGTRPSVAVEAAYAAARSAERDLPPTSTSAGRGRTSIAPGAPPARPALRYARAEVGSVAYATLGQGPDALVLVPEAWSHIETALDEPRMRRALDRLAERFVVVMLDRRGAGLSERIGVPSSFEAAVEDLRVVMDALGLPRAWMLGSSSCGGAGIELAVRQPERVAGLLLVGVNARGAWAPDYPWAMTTEAMENWIRALQEGWGGPTTLEAFAPSVAQDPAVRAWWTRTLQHSTTPLGVGALVRTLHSIDVRDRLASVRHPVLVLQRHDDLIVRHGAARYLAEHIPGAELRLLPGADHFFWHGDAEAMLAAMVDFVDRHAGSTRPPPVRT